MMSKIYWNIRRMCKGLKTRLCGLKLPQIVPVSPGGTFMVTHISAFTEKTNAGDALLPVVLRDLFNQTIGVKKWNSVHVYEKVNDRHIRKFNQDDFIVIGGGGLFLTDTNPNDLSGWQWSCSIDSLKAIKKPIIAFAIGYNRFREQEDFKPIFTEHLNAFVEQAAFVGIRNHGSIEKLKTYLHTDALKEKLTYQPCMTALISKIYPDLCDYGNKQDFVVFNCAFDRSGMRSLNKHNLESMARVALEMSRMTKVKYYSHMQSDKQILPYFDKLNVPYELVEFKSVKEMVLRYSQPRLVIGMRGHAQMIPFGCGTPILSIISHDKMQWFLDDINHPEWGADVLSPDFERQLLDKAKELYADYKECMVSIEKEKNGLWNITLDNMKQISSKIKQ